LLVTGRLSHCASSQVPVSHGPFATVHHAIRRRAVVASFVGMVRMKLPLVTV
jgi:hypothetical protein